MNRITWHWAVTPYNVTDIARRHYHFVIDGDGRVHNGQFPVSANAPGTSLRAGTYAAHTRGLNTGNIGVSLAAMLGAREVPFNAGSHPIKPVQVDALVEHTAALIRQYSIPLTRQNVLSHAEVQPTLGIPQAGKWDIMWLPGMEWPAHPVEVGDYLRERVKTAVGHFLPTPPRVSRATVRRGSRGQDVRDLQRFLKISADGVFGPMTERSVIAFQRSKQLRPDGVVGPMTWGAIGI